MKSLTSAARSAYGSTLRLTIAIGLLAALAACGSFPPTMPNAQTKSRASEALLVERPVDVRAQHLGSDIAKTGWTACAQDTLKPGEGVSLVQDRIVEAFSQSGIFQGVFKSPPQRWTLGSDIRAFCSQSRGFIYSRVAGIVAIDFTLKRDGVVVWKGAMERVVTDADKDFTGPSVAWTISQAMQHTMADALRLVLQDALAEIDKVISNQERQGPSK
jgi:hypothetical protein